jgi:hypothetical protein
LCPKALLVYNFEVAGTHTYFVADGQGAEAWLWVHNANYRNLNANKARASFAVYEIIVNGTLHKVGKAHTGRITKESGLPTRVHQQVRKLTAEYGRNNVTYEITRLGRTTTGKAKAVETSRLQAIFEQFGFVPFGNLKSFRPPT